VCLLQEFLIERLKRKFRTKNIPLHGPCLEIPKEYFEKSWESELEKLGHRVIVGQEGGKIAFYVKLNKSVTSEQTECVFLNDDLKLRKVQYGPSVVVRLPETFVKKHDIQQGDYVAVKEEASSVQFLPVIRWKTRKETNESEK